MVCYLQIVFYIWNEGLVMSEITIDLSKHCFQDGISVFKQRSVDLKHRNFIFARNGSGKSTFSSIVSKQLSDQYDVRIYNGFDSMLGENENLNAFALSVNASKNEKLIEEKQGYLDAKNVELDRILSEIGKPSTDDQIPINLTKKLLEVKKDVEEKSKNIENFFTTSAAQIKNMNSPQISSTSYNKNNFKGEMKSAIRLESDAFEQARDTAKTNKKVAKQITWNKVNLSGYLNSTNSILDDKVEEKVRIQRFNDNQDRINFASKGLEIHEHNEGEICAFCGNPISKDTFDELERYFSADEVESLKVRINSGKKRVEELITIAEGVRIEDSNFYPKFQRKAVELGRQIFEQKEKVIHFCKLLKNNLDDKEKNLFSKQNLISITVPEDIDTSEYNKLVEQNNLFGSYLDEEKEKAKLMLRQNAIKEVLEDFQYEVKSAELKSKEKQQDEIQKEIDKKELDKKFVKSAIDELENAINNLKPSAERQAIEHINRKLRGAVPWELDYYEEGNETGYYWVSQKTEDGSIVHRGVKELSTGEKNIIALLYFLEKLEDTEEIQNGIPKVIIFDDPMNSNDADMQYLIITELQRLYQGKTLERYDYQKDYIVLMTHNIHFYLNVQPHGAFKDDNKKTKYDKNNFYHIRRGYFFKVENQKQDFKTNYDALWSELCDLFENELTNSMLNSMRRIIETYIEFTGIKQENFYQGNKKYLKLFNVNSHSAIDSLSAEAFTESADELVDAFHQIFKDNNAESHFKAHWRQSKNTK